MTKKKENKPTKVSLTSDVQKVNVKQLTQELEVEKGVRVEFVNKARTETPRSKAGSELKPKVYPTEVKMVCDKKPTKAKLSKLQDIFDSHKAPSRSKADILAEAKRLLKQLDKLRD